MEEHLLYRGKKQRCPLAPLLFTNAVKPLACLICRLKEMKILLYMGDMHFLLPEADHAIKQLKF